uniref:Uncharacterized protein n=1 Tax=Mola mola TaxID=94237 RepID=A0A3Q4AL41_MOLML
MSFLMMKKKFKFHVHFTLEELTAVPFVNGVLFCKIRLIDGGDFAILSSRYVTSLLQMSVACKRSHLTIGKPQSDCNCGDFVILIMFYTCFLNIRPPSTAKSVAIGDEDPTLQLDCKGESTDETVQPPGGIMMGPRSFKPRQSSVHSSGLSEEGEFVSRPDEVFHTGHFCSSSYASQHSKISGYHTAPSRCSSLTELSCHRNALSSTSVSCRFAHHSFLHTPTPTGPHRQATLTKPERLPPPPGAALKTSRSSRKKDSVEQQPSCMDSTCIVADDIVEKIVQSQNFSDTSNNEDSNLRLFVCKDGTIALSGTQLANRETPGVLEPVVIETH